MFHKNKPEQTTYAIIGLGRFGSALAVELASGGSELLVIDEDPDKVRAMREYTESAFVVKSLDKKTLAETGVQNCDVAVVCIGEHTDISILTTLNLVGMGIPTVIAKANSIEHGEVLAKLGAEVVYPERDMAVRLANRLETSRTIDFVQLSEKINISKILVPDYLVGKTVFDIDFRENFGLNIIAVENKGTLIESVKPDYLFRKGDILYLSGGKDSFYKLTEWIEKNE